MGGKRQAKKKAAKKAGGRPASAPQAAPAPQAQALAPSPPMAGGFANNPMAAAQAATQQMYNAMASMQQMLTPFSQWAQGPPVCTPASPQRPAVQSGAVNSGGGRKLRWPCNVAGCSLAERHILIYADKTACPACKNSKGYCLNPPYGVRIQPRQDHDALWNALLAAGDTQ